ncbi:alpha-N-acetylgalactosaminide alpha-2,6-sialyltransferase 2-like [Acanthaster planci]|uniref:alpha-N-acetylgalactosaminide alpha-2,6-sialyltransferase n=1 Tax=Acanthaster planci TaxID=133434 RepID=A0A8B7Z5C0_ACAPL|nr:alpha-N-acetylgalactosaminide alpha-2,6-sialyltransferase 2-like [Acanthaster planci]
MAIPTTRVGKGILGLFVVTVCSLAVRIYVVHSSSLTVPALYHEQPNKSVNTQRTNILQRFLHSALDFSSRSNEESALNENRTLSRIERFSRSKPNSSYGEALYNNILQRARHKSTHWHLDEKEFVRDSQFLNYLRCPTTVRKKMLQETLSNQKFLPEVPILLFDEHFSHNEYQRLSKFKGINGWEDMDEKEISEALKALNMPNNRYMFDDRFVDGFIPKDIGCARCAVIGNGGMMNGSNKGKEIDAHDYVFRVNVALTKGYERDLGTKTSFYCFTMVTLSNSLRGGARLGFREPPYGKGIRYVFFADNDWTYSYLNAVLNDRPPPHSADKYRRPPPNFVKKLHAEDVKLVHPDFQRYLKWSWVNSTAQHKLVHRPTTGAIMLLLALHTCDEVNVYGFGGSYSKFSEHYYDKKFQKHVFFANHDNNAENALWRRLHELGIINLYIRN